jgi:DNA-binding transcriptional MocR family regulator
MIIPEDLMAQLGSLKEASDINTGTLNQYLINEYFDSENFELHLATIREEYKIRRDSLNDALRQNFRDCAKWQNPSNGLFTWLEFPSEFDTEKILEHSLKTHKVAFSPGHLFNVSDSRTGSNCLRLNFTHNRPETIFEGIYKICKTIEEVV